MSFYVLEEYRDLFLSGFRMTVYLSVASWLLAVSVGFVVAQLRSSRSIIVRTIGAVYVEVFRNVPPIVVIFFFYFGLPSADIRLSSFTTVALGVGLYGGANMAEIIRSGISAIHPGQHEAAIASGMSNLQVARLIVFPQALRIVIPPMGTETINVIKNTSLGAVVSAGEILGAANLAGAHTFAYAVTFLAAAVLYLSLTLPAAAVVNALERHVRL